jgi:hypothetical protein
MKSIHLPQQGWRECGALPARHQIQYTAQAQVEGVCAQPGA